MTSDGINIENEGIDDFKDNENNENNKEEE